MTHLPHLRKQGTAAALSLNPPSYPDPNLGHKPKEDSISNDHSPSPFPAQEGPNTWSNRSRPQYKGKGKRKIDDPEPDTTTNKKPPPSRPQYKGKGKRKIDDPEADTPIDKNPSPYPSTPYKYGQKPQPTLKIRVPWKKPNSEENRKVDNHLSSPTHIERPTLTIRIPIKTTKGKAPPPILASQPNSTQHIVETEKALDKNHRLLPPNQNPQTPPAPIAPESPDQSRKEPTSLPQIKDESKSIYDLGPRQEQIAKSRAERLLLRNLQKKAEQEPKPPDI